MAPRYAHEICAELALITFFADPVPAYDKILVFLDPDLHIALPSSCCTLATHAAKGRPTGHSIKTNMQVEQRRVESKV